ncbi:MAG: MarP family serine protease [Acidimicrobiales bacterium]
MNLLDLVVIGLAISGAIGGFRMGLLARALSWIGLAVGLYVGARIVPTILRKAAAASPSGRLLVVLAVVVGLALLGLGLGLVVGSRLQRVLPGGPLRQVDRVAGAAVGVAGIFVALWLLLPAVSSVNGWPARATRSSAISRWVSGPFPRPPNTVASLTRLVSHDLQPEVFATLHPGEVAGPPPAAAPMTAAVQATVAASTVKVEGQACNRIQDGSGFAVGTDLVVTNAHVVAGEPAGQTAVILPSSQRLPARVVLFDPDRDLALLSVPGLGERPLPVGTATVGSTGAVFGHPGGQAALAIAPAGVSQEITAEGEDLYNTHTTRRDVFVLASSLAPGDSGGAFVSPQGSVVGVAFAIAPDRPGTAYALTSKELKADLVATTASPSVSTRACLLD